VVLLLVESALLLSVFACFLAAFVVDRGAVRAGDYLRFESRAVLSQRLTLAGIALAIVEIVVAAPVIGAAIALAAAGWTLWWLPASHRAFDVAVESVFDAPPEAVAAVMFDVSEEPRWMDSVVRTAVETPGLLRTGSVVRQTIRLSGHDLVARLVVTELVPYERLRFAVDVRHAVLFDLFEVVPHPHGSLVRYAGHHQLSRVNAIVSGWRFGALNRRFRARRAANLERLRVLVRREPLARRA
jgi:Polyketide cyclase / dehydrase and lipid transport